VDALGAFLEENGMTVVDPPGEYYGRSYYAVYFTDPDGMKLEAMVYKPPPKQTAGGEEEIGWDREFKLRSRARGRWSRSSLVS